MNKKLFTVLSLCTALTAFDAFAAPRACCRPEPEWYVAISGSAVFLDDVTFEHSPAYATPDFQTFDTGYAVTGALGYRVLSDIRAELEFALRESEVGSDPGSLNGVPENSSMRSMALMVNGYYDWRNATLITPYLGAGVGGAYVKSSRFYQDIGTGETTPTQRGFGFAYQFMAGLTYELESQSFKPIELLLGYRYFTVREIESDKSLSAAPETFKFDNESHNIELGARLYF